MMNNKTSKLLKKPFGSVEGQEVSLFSLSNGELDVELTNYGATIVSIFTPDRQGRKSNIVSGFKELKPYQQDHPYMGCVVGRYANRIAYGRFELEGVSYQLPVNDGLNHLHGGFTGFNRKVWSIDSVIEEEGAAGIQFSCTSKGGEEGYPGNLKVAVLYMLTEDNQLQIHYKATTDKPTIISLTNHTYFNLSGFEKETIYDHYLHVNARTYTVKNERNTPSGELAGTLGTPLDFHKPKRIGADIHELKTDRGYDHNYVLEYGTGEVKEAAGLYEPESGRRLRVLTNQPGIQVYTANWWDGTLVGYQGKPYQQHGAVALETQAFPDAPNHPHFPDPVLRQGEVYTRATIFQFSVES
jgi:aldose 1-epimerase